MDFKRRIKSIIREFENASRERWDFKISSGDSILLIESKSNIRTGRRPTVKSRIDRKSHGLKSFAKKKAGYKLARIASPVIRAELQPFARNIQFQEISSGAIPRVVVKSNKYVSKATLKMEYLLNNLYRCSKNDLINNTQEVHKLYSTIDQYVKIDSEWRKSNNVQIENVTAENQKLIVFSYKLKNLERAYVAMSHEKEIPEEVYRKMSFSEKINSFRFLGPNWDDEGAEAVTKISIKNALDFLEKSTVEPCFVYATYEGNVGIDFKKNNLRLRTQILSAEKMKCTIVEDRKTIIYNEIVPQTMFASILKKIDL